YDAVSKSAVGYNQIDINVSFNAPNNPKTRPMGEDRFSQRIFPHLLSNYEQSRQWHYSPSSTTSMIAGSPFDSASTWYRIKTVAEGLHKISYSFLASAGIFPGDIDPRTFRVWGSPGHNLPTDNDEEYPMLREMPIFVQGENDGSFDSGDYLLFYAPAVNRFAYDSTMQRDIYQINSFTSENCFYLTFGLGAFSDDPKRWQSIDVSPGSVSLPEIDEFYDFVRFEDNNQLHRNSDGEIDDYFTWYMSSITEFTPSQLLRDVVTGDTAWVHSRAYSRQAEVVINGNNETNSRYSNRITTTPTLNLLNGWNQFEFSYSDEVDFDYFDTQYKRYIKPANWNLRFRAAQSQGEYIFQVDGGESGSLLLDITDPLDPDRLTGAEKNGNYLEFRYLSEGMITNFYYADADSALTPSRLELYQPAGLRSTLNSADGIIIVYDEFREQAERLAAHRASNDGLNLMIVDVSDIYDEFGWGRNDPLAIRYFLKYAFLNWGSPKPSSCTMVGDGHYDYMGYLGTGAVNYLPPFHNLPPGLFRSWASDDNYVFFGRDGYYDSDSSDYPDMLIARIPVKNNSQLETVIDKIINYDTDLLIDQWKNTITVVADDQYGDDLLSDTTEWFHTSQAEALSNEHIPGSFKKNKIYATAYPMEAGRTKPQVNRQIINSFNDGSLIVDYIGHGNKNTWMHEHVFTKAEDMPKIKNRRKLAMILAASCSIGFWDELGDEGMSEDFLRLTENGAISIISATRSVFAGPNTDLNNLIFDLLLGSDSLTIAEAVYLAKLQRQQNGSPIENDRHFMIFGDSEQKLALPDYNVQITSVGTGTAADTLNALAVATVTGEVKDRQGNDLTGFNGTVYINAYDALKEVEYGGSREYYLPGNTLFRGPAEVAGGSFTASFLVPKDISYGDSTASVIAYIIDESQLYDGSGYRESLHLGRAAGAPDDSIGPSIEVYIDNSQVSGNTVSVGPEFALRVVLSDTNGINLTGQAGHNISFKIDDGEALDEDLTQYFNYDLGDFRNGSLTYDITGLSPGEYRAELKAWDNVNNSSEKEFNIFVASQSGTDLVDVMNYPNPFENETVFQYLLQGQENTDVKIKIYTLSGLLIRTLDNCPSDRTYNFVQWNGRDDDGDEIANGVYIYKVIADGPGGKAESFQKAVKLK
ncbi:MAG: type IX secretion system sortase PorU, partial [candidate division Zixibacteria bacterium]|nr:type IX secretion system sortase PorU [candidate division Zixibacteria bacterium]